LKVSDLNEIVAKTIMKMIWDLKVLTSVDLLMKARNKSEEALKYLDSEFKQLNKRLKASLQM